MDSDREAFLTDVVFGGPPLQIRELPKGHTYGR